jgi:hypothetical protein
MNSRRKFLQTGLLASAGLSMPAFVSAESLRALADKIAPSDQLNFGVIGCKRHGLVRYECTPKDTEGQLHCTGRH